MMSTAKTFEQNLADLLEMKKELLILKCTYSSQALNYHQEKHIQAQNIQIAKAEEEAEYIKVQAEENEAKMSELTKELKQYNEVLKKENASLKQRNSILQEEIDTSFQERKVRSESQMSEVIEKSTEVAKLKREIDNLKLMHSQELYILKKGRK